MGHFSYTLFLAAALSAGMRWPTERLFASECTAVSMFSAPFS